MKECTHSSYTITQNTLKTHMCMQQPHHKLMDLFTQLLHACLYQNLARLNSYSLNLLLINHVTSFNTEVIKLFGGQRKI